jgi:hypothetical protein
VRFQKNNPRAAALICSLLSPDIGYGRFSASLSRPFRFEHLSEHESSVAGELKVDFPSAFRIALKTGRIRGDFIRSKIYCPECIH